MALALNNLKRVDMPLNKETKPNQTSLIEWAYPFCVLWRVLWQYKIPLSPSYVLNSTTTALLQGWFEYPAKVDMPLNKPNQNNKMTHIT